MSKPAIGIIGCGAIGRAILQAADTGALDIRIAGVSSRTETSAVAFLSTLRTPPRYLRRAALIEQSDMIVEAAGPDVVPDLARETFDAGKGLMVISVGAVIAHPWLLERARETGCRLLLPSGAIAGLDGIKSACAGPVDYVTMVSRKPPAALEGAPFVVEQGIDLGALTTEQEIFSGTAREACRAFPNNLNVCAAVSVAGIGPDRTTVKMVAVPGLARNCHDVEVAGDFGLLRIHVENEPSENPKTGKLTALSIIRSLQQSIDPVQIGT